MDLGNQDKPVNHNYLKVWIRRHSNVTRLQRFRPTSDPQQNTNTDHASSTELTGSKTEHQIDDLVTKPVSSRNSLIEDQQSIKVLKEKEKSLNSIPIPEANNSQLSQHDKAATLEDSIEETK